MDLFGKMDLFGEETKRKWGGKRTNAGRPKIQEKRRILALEKEIKKLAEREKHFLEIPPKKQGAHRIACEFIKQIAHLIPQE